MLTKKQIKQVNQQLEGNPRELVRAGFITHMLHGDKKLTHNQLRIIIDLARQHDGTIERARELKRKIEHTKSGKEITNFLLTEFCINQKKKIPLSEITKNTPYCHVTVKRRLDKIQDLELITCRWETGPIKNAQRKTYEPTHRLFNYWYWHKIITEALAEKPKLENHIEEKQ